MMTLKRRPNNNATYTSYVLGKVYMACNEYAAEQKELRLSTVAVTAVGSVHQHDIDIITSC